MAMVWRLRGDAEADPFTHAAAVFDAGGKTFRHRLYPEYKANRPAARRQELAVQLPYMRHAADALGLKAVEKKGYEADDVIATLANVAVANGGMRVTIVSSDKDMCQLVRDGWIEIAEPLSHTRIRAQQVREKFGVGPELVPDVQALTGDAVDNVPGVPGIGDVKAAALIRRHGNLRRLLDAAAKGKVGSPAQQIALKRGRERALLCHKLVTLRRNVNLDISWEEMVCKPVETQHIMEMLRVLEAGQKFQAMFDPSTVRTRLVHALAANDDPYAYHKAAMVEERRRTKDSAYRSKLPIPDAPQPGWYKRRLIRNGPWVPARIWRHPEIDFVTDKPSGRDMLLCEVNGERREAELQWGALCLRPISEVDFNFMVKNAVWAKAHAPHEPEANPEKPTNWNTVPV